MMLPIVIGAAAVVGVLWTFMTGSLLHWIPIVAACGVGIVLTKIGKKDKK